LTTLIQALVFMLLSTIYIALVMPHHDHGEEHASR
jgi:F0F1-type ATP synthase membrane subunit a